MAEPTAAGFQFDCDLCDEECFGVPSIISPKHPYVVDEVCAQESIVPLILAAKANEYSYPPAWGNVIIDYRHFLHRLPEGFEEDFLNRREEYRTPLTQRIYCRRERQKNIPGVEEQCGGFMGRKVKYQPDDPTVRSCSTCRDASFMSCMHCGEVLPGSCFDVVLFHSCTKPRDDDAAAFQGLIQGVHYQKCPGCDMKIELAEACNALVCLGHACRTPFCAICGLPAKHNSNHWQAGSPCPRWKLPTDPRASFDPVPERRDAQRSPEWRAAQRLWDLELEIWRQRDWNHQLVRDEVHVKHLLRAFENTTEDAAMERTETRLRNFFNDLQVVLYRHFEWDHDRNIAVRMAETRFRILREELAGDRNFTILRCLVILLQAAMYMIPLHRGVGLHLTEEHLRLLWIDYMSKLASIAVVWESIEVKVMFKHPRLVDVYQRTVDELEWLAADTAARLREPPRPARAIEPNMNAIHEVDMSALQDRPLLMAEYLRAYEGLEAMRLGLIEREIARPEWLGAAIDMFWLQYSNLNISSLFQDATSSRVRLYYMAHFLAQHQEIELRREQTDLTPWPDMLAEESEEGWRKKMEAYDEFADRFMDMIPVDMLADYMRGWRG